MRISLAPIGLREYIKQPSADNVGTFLKRIKQIGYEGLEMATPAGLTREVYKRLLDENELTAVSAHMAPLSENISEMIAECHAIGAKNVMVSSMPSIALGNPFELNRFIAWLNRMGGFLKNEGIHLSYHNHAVDFARVNGKTMFERIVDGTDPAAVFLEPDTHWLQAGGAHVILWLQKLRGRLYAVHFKDYAIDPYSDHAFLEGTHKLFAEVGEGNLNWPGIIAECLDQGIAWCSVEQDSCQKPPYEAAALSLRNLRAYGL